jgi:hypothetical protein
MFCSPTSFSAIASVIQVLRELLPGAAQARHVDCGPDLGIEAKALAPLSSSLNPTSGDFVGAQENEACQV